MLNSLEEAPWYLSSAIITFGAALLSVIGLFIVRYFINTKKMKDHHDVAGFTFGIIGVMYAVLLSYIVVDVHDRYNEVHQNIDLEANLAAELYRDAEVFPVEIKKNIKADIRRYVQLILEDGSEFNLKGEANLKIQETVAGLWKVYYGFEPKTNREKIWYAESIKKLNDLNRARILRLFNNNESIGTMMWTMLIAGAFVTISFMYFFRVDHFLFQALMTGILAGFIALMLFLILSLDTVFVGDIHVSKDHFAEVLNFFDTWDQDALKP